MKQFLKALFVVGVLTVATVVTFVISQGQMEVETTLALEQFADPSLVTDTALRTSQRAFGTVSLVIWVVAILICLLTYFTEIKNGIRYLFTRNEDIEDAEDYRVDL